jgi:hypothetical protein
MKIKLLFVFSILYSSFQAQTEAELKGFINKNNVIIHSVQKNLMAENNPSYLLTFKEVLKNQGSCVKAFATNKQASAYLALAVRKECLEFLRKNSKKSLSYFELTEAEKNMSTVKDNTPFLSAGEIKAIENLDPLNPQELNTLTLTVQ